MKRQYSPYEWGYGMTAGNYLARGRIALAAFAAFLIVAILIERLT